MIEAEMPDGAVLEFPDGTSPDVMQAAAKKYLGVAQTTAPIPEQAQSSHMQAPDQMQASHTPAPLPEQMQSRSPVEGTSFFDKAGNDIMDRMGKIGEFAGGYGEGIGGGLKAAANAPAIATVAAGQGMLAAGDVAMQGVSSLAKTAYGALPESDQKFIGDTAKAAGRKIVDSPVGQFGADVAKKGLDFYEGIKEDYPKEAVALESVFGILGMPYAKKAATSLANSAMKPVSKAKKLIADAASPVSVKDATNYADKQVDKFAKGTLAPAVSKQKTAPIVENYKADTKTAVNAIVKNKKALQFEDEFGGYISRVPRTAEELQEAVHQTKRSIWEKIETKAKSADAAEEIRPFTSLKDVKKGERVVYTKGKATGIGSKESFQVRGDDIGEALRPIVDSKVLNKEAKAAVKYAQKTIDDYKGFTYSPTQAQDAIKVRNASLKAFYKDPSVKNYNKMMIDEIVANNMRKQLNDIIENSTGKGYRELRNEYKSLKTIEDEVARVAAKERKKIKGTVMPSFTDVIASHQIITGLASANMAKVLGGGFLGGVSKLRKLFGDPNKQIEKMFKAVDNSVKAANR